IRRLSEPPPTSTAPPVVVDESATDIAGTWSVYQRMVGAGVGPASLEELLSGGSAGRGPGAPHAEVPSGNGGEGVDIRTLLYKGTRAQELRDLAKRSSGDELRAIIDELGDLVVLAIEPE